MDSGSGASGGGWGGGQQERTGLRRWSSGFWEQDISLGGPGLSLETGVRYCRQNRDGEQKDETLFASTFVCPPCRQG